MSEPPAPDDRSRPLLGFWTGSALVAGNMIGSGIFLLPAALAAYGGISIVGWLFTTAGSLLLAVVFMSLSRAYPKVGGPYAYAREAFGDFAGFIVAYGYWISILCGNAAIAIVSVSYFSVLFPALTTASHLDVWAALAVLWTLTAVNLLGVRVSGGVQLATTVLKVLPLLVIALFGLLDFDVEHFTPFNVSEHGSASAITATAALTLWAFLGLESATIPADSIRDPRRTIPRATIAGTIVAALIYVLSTVSIMGLLSPAELAGSHAPFADAATRLFGSTAGYVVACAGAVACVGALNGWVLLQGQMPRAAALDGLFPGRFRALSGSGVPVLGTVVSSACISALLLMNYMEGYVEKFTFAILLATLATLVPYLASALAQLKFIVQARHRPGLTGLAIVAVLAFLYSAWAVVGLGAYTIFWGVVMLATGVPLFAWMRARPRARA